MDDKHLAGLSDDKAPQVTTNTLEYVTSHDSGLSIDSFDADLRKPGQRQPEDTPREHPHVSGIALYIAFGALLSTEFVGGITMQLLGPTTPIIASIFNAESQLGLLTGMNFMPQVGGMLLFGQFLSNYNAKHCLMAAFVISMIGALLSGTANGFGQLVFGRAVSGFGTAGQLVSFQSIISMIFPLDIRPKLFGLFGLQNVISGTVGPIAAGALVGAGQWRWNFLTLLPLGAAALAIIQFGIPSLAAFPIEEKYQRKLDKQLSRFGWSPQSETVRRLVLVDVLGYTIVTVACLLLILALQWGGTVYAWNSATIIGLFVGFFAIMGLFVAWESQAAWPILAPNAFQNRTIIGASVLGMFNFMAVLFINSFLPVLYEATRGQSAISTSIQTLPGLLTSTVVGLVIGFVISYTGRYWYWGLIGPSISGVAAFLFFKVSPATSNITLILYQILFSVGISLVMPLTFIAVQADVAPKDAPQALATVNFVQTFGGLLGPTVGNAILNASLRQKFTAFGVQADVATQVENSIAVIDTLPAKVKELVIGAYTGALNNVFVSAAPMLGVAFLAVFLIRNKSLKAPGRT